MPNAVSLRGQLLLRLLVPLLGVSLIGATLTCYLAFRFSAAVFDRNLSGAVIDLRHEILEAAAADRIGRIKEESDFLSAKRVGILYNVIDRFGKIVAGTASFPPPSDSVAPLGADSQVQFYDTMVDDDPYRIASLRIPMASGADDFLQVQVGELQGKQDILIEEMLAAAIPQELLLALFVVLAVMYGVRRAIRPINDFGRVIAARAARDLEPLDPDAVPVEARYLVSSINDLMQRVKGVADAQQRSIADAAHLMQTPLAGMKAQIELGQRQEVSEETRRVMGQIHRAVDHLSSMLREMLVLARNDPFVRESVPLAPIDLHQVVCDTTTEWVPMAIAKGIDLGCTSFSRGVMIPGNAGRLKDLIDSLLDNAIRYTQSGGEVTVGFDPEDRTTLRVLDNGQGIPIEERGRVFNRFYRVLGNGAEGSGLGLAIVKEIAELHGATVELNSGPGNIGTEFRVAFPKATIQPEAGVPMGRVCALGEPA